MKQSVAHTLLASTLVIACSVAFAQSASAPMAIGESASTAARAQAKAASGSDVGSLVRTGPSATRKAEHMAHGAEDSASGASHRHTHHVHHASTAASAASN